MAILRSIVAVVGGFVLMAALVIAGTFSAAALLAGPGGEPGTSYLAANLLLSFLAAVAGGHACGRIAGRSPLLHAAALALIVLALGLLGEGGSVQPHWYKLLIPILGSAGVMAGAWLVRRRGGFDLDPAEA